jgi:hypothetical protein
MTKRPRPIASCDMFPENGKRHCSITVMRTVGELRLLAKQLEVGPYSSLSGFAKSHGGQPRFCTIGLYVKGLSPRIVSHEFTHMALMYLAEVDDPPRDPWRSANERLCHIVGNSTADFYCWAKDKGLY